MSSKRVHTTAVLAVLLAMASAGAAAKDVKVSLTGAEETPPVTTSATGKGTIHIAKDKSVSGTVKTTGVEGIAAHIHVGAKGEAGPPIITLTKGADGAWTVPGTAAHPVPFTTTATCRATSPASEAKSRSGIVPDACSTSVLSVRT